MPASASGSPQRLTADRSLQKTQLSHSRIGNRSYNLSSAISRCRLVTNETINWTQIVFISQSLITLNPPRHVVPKRSQADEPEVERLGVQGDGKSTFFPALALGPIVEQLAMLAGTLFSSS